MSTDNRMSTGWRLEIHHATKVRYQGPVRASYNEARMTPLTLPGQNPLTTRISTEMPAPIWTYTDYWGTLVSSFDILAAHRDLVIRATASVETAAPAGLARPLAWPALAERAGGGQLLEYLIPTERTTVNQGLAEAARRRVAGADPLETAAEIASWVGSRVAYVPGATEVQTSAQEAWDQGQGVCQDMAHLTVALLREVGLPARYVSGYLYPHPEARPGDSVAGQSHAWVEYWTGDWAACDPTSGATVGERHVVVARGRDYADVPPFKGIYQGAPGSNMDVTVRLTRVA
jgi:transglutaminase-like putative cysteine protease